MHTTVSSTAEFAYRALSLLLHRWCTALTPRHLWCKLAIQFSLSVAFHYFRYCLNISGDLQPIACPLFSAKSEIRMFSNYTVETLISTDDTGQKWKKMLIKFSYIQKVTHWSLAFDYVNVRSQFVLSGYKILLSLAELACCACGNLMLNHLQKGTAWTYETPIIKTQNNIKEH